MAAPTLPLTSPGYLREAEAAEIAGLAASTLAKMRWKGGGPPFVRVGRRIRYPEDKLLEWIESRTQVYRSTSEAAT